jgi:hypothetical protein
MEESTPPVNHTGSFRHSQAAIVPCDLPLPTDGDDCNDDMFLLDEDEFGPHIGTTCNDDVFLLDEDEFGPHIGNAGPPVQSVYVPDVDMAPDDVLGEFEVDANEETEVHTRTCYCQAPPTSLPPHYTPCCLPLGVRLATREIQMFPEFRKNLLLTEDAPPKTQTCRVWGAHRARTHKESFREGKWIRVWRGQGHKDTIGWLLITHWDEMKVGDIDKGDCVREGRPEWEPSMFKETYLRGMGDAAALTRIKFGFRPCRACIAR